MDYSAIFDLCKQHSISGRYLPLSVIEPMLLSEHRTHKTDIIGQSVLGNPIYRYQFGMGSIKILMWSQMHGNESTTTKAICDLLNFFELDNDFVHEIFNKCTICIVPILNPDGALAYTRENAAGIDLNRDAINLSQPESKVLRDLFLDFKPDYCYNMHDQRTIYGVGETNMPATVSFLAPAYNEARQFNESRNKAISIICKMNDALQKYIPNQVGRFDDGYNPNCVGDTFQMFGVPTILFEAGHFPNDYEREHTRKYIFIALLSSFETIKDANMNANSINEYLNIPLNNTKFLDIIYKNVSLHYDNLKISLNFAAQYNEELINDQIYFNAYIVNIDNLDGQIAHREYDFNNIELVDVDNNYLEIGQKADFLLKDGTEIVNGVIIS